MATKVSRADMWVAVMPDQPGALAQKLEPLAKAGVNLDAILARRHPEQAGQAEVFITPLRSPKQKKAAQEAGFAQCTTVFGLRVDCANKPGMGAKIAKALGDAGINIRGLTAAVIGNKAVVYLGLNSAEDAAKATRILKKL